MKIAVDKESYKVAKNDGNEYVYLFNDETLDDLLKIKLHCLHYSYCKYVDINTIQYIGRLSFLSTAWSFILFFSKLSFIGV